MAAVAAEVEGREKYATGEKLRLKVEIPLDRRLNPSALANFFFRKKIS